MSRSSNARRLRIPVKFIDGQWEFFHGGPVPLLDGAEAELLVDRKSISDKSFIKMMDRTEKHKVLDQGTALLVGLTIKPDKPPSKELKPLLIDFYVSQSRTSRGDKMCDVRNAAYSQINAFVEVRLAEPSDKQLRLFETGVGGLWLVTEGFKATGLTSTTIRLDDKISTERVASLNHALTKLSETFETWRISHTGNIYTRVFYQEKNRNWYPLDVLRNAALDKNEQHIAKELWDTFLAKMSPATDASRRK